MDLLTNCCSITAVGVIGIFTATVAYFVFGRKVTLPKNYSKWKTKDYPKDVVLLHHIGRGPYAPSVSPFALKLETYLRIAKIPYQNIFSYKFGPKGKIPWMEYNGEVLTDSEFCLHFLNSKLGVDLNNKLSAEQKAVAVMLQRKVDEHVYWTIMADRWVFGSGWNTLLMSGCPRIVIWFLRKIIRNACFGQGVGRHSLEEIEHIVRNNLQALSHFLGDKQFMMGDEPSDVDCSVFGELSQMRWQLGGSPGDRIIKEHHNLVTYLYRIKDKWWPDWDDCTTKGSTVKATA